MSIRIAPSLLSADFVLVMTVNPGLGGQELIPDSVDKVRRLAEMAAGRPLAITVDGGVGPDNARALVAAGATTLVVGSSVFGAPDRTRAIRDLRRAVEEEE